MRLSTLPRLALTAIAAFAVSACGSGSNGASGPGRITVRLVDGPAPEYKKILLNIERVELNSDANGWETIATPNQVYDLLALRNGVSATLVDGKTIAEGHYTGMRLVLGSGNKIVLQDDSEHDLTVPSGMQSGVKINTTFDVAPNTTKDLFIDVDGHRSVFVHETGASGKYMLRPVVRCLDRVVTGSILGVLVDAQSQAPLAGATVYAETVDTNGNPAIVTSATTAADGSYVLGPLAVDVTYFAVSQPVVGATTRTAYGAKASGPIALTAAAPTPGWGAAFDALPTTSVANLTGAIAPAATNQDDRVAIAQTFPLSITTTVTLIVRETNGIVTTTTPATESYVAGDLPAGPYALWVTRRTTDDATQISTDVTSNVTTANVGAGAQTLDLNNLTFH